MSAIEVHRRSTDMENNQNAVVLVPVIVFRPLLRRHGLRLAFRVERHERNGLQHVAKYDGVDGQ